MTSARYRRRNIIERNVRAKAQSEVRAIRMLRDEQRDAEILGSPTSLLLDIEESIDSHRTKLQSLLDVLPEGSLREARIADMRSMFHERNVPVNMHNELMKRELERAF